MTLNERCRSCGRDDGLHDAGCLVESKLVQQVILHKGGRYVAEAGYAFGRPYKLPGKPPGKPPSKESKEPRCRSCGRTDGQHDAGCLAEARRARQKLQAECKHHVEYGVLRTAGDPPGPPCCGQCGIELDDVLPPPVDAREPSPWIFAESYASGTGCQHSSLALLNEPEPVLRCCSCSKQWVFVPAGAETSYFDDDDPSFPSMIDNRGWPKGQRAVVAAVERRSED